MIKQDPIACSIHLFGSQPLADDFTLPLVNALRGNFSGPPAPSRCEPPPDFERCPTGLATLVYPVVRAVVRVGEEALAPLPGPPDSLDPLTISTCALVKLRVSSQQWNGPLWVDCDREVVVPSPHVCVDITTPATWQADPPSSARAGGGTDLVWDVFLQLKICRAFCCRDWPPIVTEQFLADEATPTDTVRPRGARKLSVGLPIAAPVDLLAFQGDPAAGGVAVAILRRTLGAPIDLDGLPSFTHLRCPAIATGPRVVYSWEVAP